MTDAPKQIFAWVYKGSEYGEYFPEAVEAEGKYGGHATKYVRADIADELLEVLKWVEATGMCEHGNGGILLRQTIAKAEGKDT